MEPAAGYHDRVPHDLAHFIVEKHLRLRGGVFGRLADGGHAFQPIDGSRPRRKKGNDKITAQQRREAELAERVIDIAFHQWEHRRYAGALAKGVTAADVNAICGEFERVGSQWTKLHVGESLTFEW